MDNSELDPGQIPGGTVLHFMTSERTKLMAGCARRDHAVNYITPVTSFAPASRPPPSPASNNDQWVGWVFAYLTLSVFSFS